MSCTGAGLAAWADLAIFSDVLPKQICLFIVNRQRLICTELTNFWLRKEAAFAAAFREPLMVFVLQPFITPILFCMKPDRFL